MITAWFHAHAEGWTMFWTGFCVGLLWCRFLVFKRVG